MQKTKSIGDVKWDIKKIKSEIDSFLDVYNRRPIKVNDGGMKTPHMFATWFMLKQLNPKIIIESGVWKGQGTWLIEQAVPDAKLYCFDVNLSYRQYISDKATYTEADFTTFDWSKLKNKGDTLLFFDDHQNALDRIKKGKALGFKNFIFEDNYPAKQGDCYSLKKAFQHAGFQHAKQNKKGIISKIKDLFTSDERVNIPPNGEDEKYLQDVLEIYHEFPPVFKKPTTRWGDIWSAEHYPTPEPLFTNEEKQLYPLLWEEAAYYTWICYCKLK